MKLIANPAIVCRDWCTNHHGQDDLFHSKRVAEYGDLSVDIVQRVDLSDDGRSTIVGDPVAEAVLRGDALLRDLSEDECLALASLSCSEWQYLTGRLVAAADLLATIGDEH